MSFLKTVIFFCSMFFIIIFFGCDSSTERYLFEKPAQFSVIKGIRCSNGNISYIGFVTDDTKEFGTRIKKISGCSSKIDKDFKDANDDKRGIFVGGRPVSVDQIERFGRIYIATAVSGFVPYEKSSKAKGYKETALEIHRGRVALRKLTPFFKHEPDYDSSYLLNYNPHQIKAFQKEGFIVTGSYFGKFHISFIAFNPEAQDDVEIVENNLPFFPSDLQCRDRKCFIFNSKDGELYELNPLDLSLQLKVSGYDASIERNRGFKLISNDRILVYDGDRVDVFSKDFENLNTIELPSGFSIISVSDVNYPGMLLYRKFTQDDMFKRVDLFVSDSIVEADESVESDLTELSEEEVIYDASQGDVVWIASSAGKIIAFDLETNSWLVTSYSDDKKEDVPEYYRELRPYIANKYKTFPAHGKTDASNSPEMIKVSSIRGLFDTVFYRFTYEGAIEGLDSVTGYYDNEEWLFVDDNADFENVIVPETDNIILRGKKNSSKCMIPWNENAIFSIEEVLGSNVLEVFIEKYKDQISECYGEMLSYSVFPQNMYSVSKEISGSLDFAGRAPELSEESPFEESSLSFSDDTVSVWIKRSTDEVVTEKEFSYFLRLRPGVPYIGFSSNDVMVRMEDAVPGRVLMFSPLTRRFVEYDVVKGKIIKVYK